MVFIGRLVSRPKTSLSRPLRFGLAKARIPGRSFFNFFPPLLFTFLLLPSINHVGSCSNITATCALLHSLGPSFKNRLTLQNILLGPHWRQHPTFPRCVASQDHLAIRMYSFACSWSRSRGADDSTIFPFLLDPLSMGSQAR